jgi:hypothetical protein
MGRETSKPDLETYLLRAHEDEEYDLDGEAQPDGVMYVDWTDSAVDAFEAIQSALPEGTFWFEMLDEEETRFRIACGKREEVVELPGLASDDPGGDGLDSMISARDVLRPDYEIKILSFTANSDTIGYVVASTAFFDGFLRKHADVFGDLFVELEDLEAEWEEELEGDFEDDEDDETYEDE